MQEVYRRFGRPPTDLVHDHFTHCLKSWCLCHSCCSGRWFAKGLTNLLVSNVCYIVSWIRTDSKMHQNCTQLILMVRSYPKKNNNNNNNERKPVLTVIGIKKKNSEKMCIKLLTRASTLDMFCHIKIIWKLNEWVQFLFVSCFPVKNNTDEQVYGYGPGYSKLGSDNPRLLWNLISDLKGLKENLV